MNAIKSRLARSALGLAGALVAVAAPSGASAALTYDAVAQFGNSHFSYGTGNGALGTFNPLPAQTDCLGSSAISCYATNKDFVPTVAKNSGPATTVLSTIAFPTDALLLHPDDGPVNSDAIVRFTSTFSSLYSFDSVFSRLDTSNGQGNGVVVSVFRTIAGSVIPALIGTTDLQATGPLSNQTGQTIGLSKTGVQLNAGDSLSFVVSNNGDYQFDGTGFSAVITAVPEASSWAMMIVGLGFAGTMLRRRSKVRSAVAFA